MADTFTSAQLGIGVPASGGGFPRVSADEQARRNAETAGILQFELDTGRGDPTEIRKNLAKMTSDNPFKLAGGDPNKVGQTDDGFGGNAFNKGPVGAGGGGAGETFSSADLGITPQLGFVEGFMKAIKSPGEAIKHGMVGNLRRAAQAGKFNQKLSEIFQSVPETIKHFSMPELVDAAKKDPGGMAANFINSIMGDPEQLLIPLGIGGSVARAGGRAAGLPGKMAGSAAEAATVGSALNTMIAASEQFDKTGKIDWRQLAEPAESGGMFGAAFGAAAPVISKLFPKKDSRANTPRQTVVDDIVPDTQPTPGGLMVDKVNDVLGMKDTDALRNAQATAYRLMTQNASAKAVEAARKKNPLVGQVIDEQMARRAEAIEGMKETRQGEHLGPDGEPLPAGAPRVGVGATGTDMVAPKTEPLNIIRLADKRGIQLSDSTKMGLMAAGAGGLYAMMNPDEVESGMGAAAAGAALAVKGKGGMWHPEAVRRLSKPLENRIITGEGASRLADGSPAFPEKLKQETEALDWSKKAIRNYLNKYAGTEGDPLKDVEIPHGTGVARWEALTDALINKQTAAEYKVGDGRNSVVAQQRDLLKNVPDNEPVYSTSVLSRVEGSPEYANRSIQSYLSHVGDYLRQNVDPAKLSQYDLVRAVKETAANDARVAREMEKASTASTAQMPVHKAYPDGYKWVEVKLPEKLTPEQAAGVRRMTDKELKGEYAKDMDLGDYTPGEVAYVAVDSKGKPIVNSYTEQLAGAATPEQAWLAGRLAEEGNTMGHCVGGYCEGVASGESKIYSLRDDKGRSHVTVEAAPADVRSNRHNPDTFWRNASPEYQAKYPEPSGNEISTRDAINWHRAIIGSPEYRTFMKEQPSDLLQIKGKQYLSRSSQD